MENSATVLKALLEEGTVSYHSIFAKAFRSVPAGVFISQLYFYQAKAKYKTPETHRVFEGKQFVCKTAAEWQDDTALTNEQQMLVRKLLNKHNVMLEVKAGLPAKLWLHIDFDGLVTAINTYLQTGLPVSVDNRNKNWFKTQTVRGKKPKLAEVLNQSNIKVESIKESIKESITVAPKKPPAKKVKPTRKTKGKTCTSPAWMVEAFDAQYATSFTGIGKFEWANKHFGLQGLGGFYELLAKRHIDKEKAKGIIVEQAPEESLQLAWVEFLKAAASLPWVLKGFFTPCDLLSQFPKIIQAKQQAMKAASAPANPTGASYSAPQIPVFKPSK